jgi:hypothetical protein
VPSFIRYVKPLEPKAGAPVIPCEQGGLAERIILGDGAQDGGAAVDVSERHGWVLKRSGMVLTIRSCRAIRQPV